MNFSSFGCDSLTLRGCGFSIYGHTHNLHKLHQVHKSYTIYLCVWNLAIYTTSCQGGNKHTLILHNDDQNTLYVFVSKDTHDACLSLHCQ